MGHLTRIYYLTTTLLVFLSALGPLAHGGSGGDPAFGGSGGDPAFGGSGGDPAFGGSGGVESQWTAAPSQTGGGARETNAAGHNPHTANTPTAPTMDPGATAPSSFGPYATSTPPQSPPPAQTISTGPTAPGQTVTTNTQTPQVSTIALPPTLNQTESQAKAMKLYGAAAKEAAVVSVATVAEGLLSMARENNPGIKPGTLLQAGKEGAEAAHRFHSVSLEAEQRLDRDRVTAEQENRKPLALGRKELSSGVTGQILEEFEEAFQKPREELAKKVLSPEFQSESLGALLPVPESSGRKAISGALEAAANATPGERDAVRKGSRSGSLMETLLANIAKYGAEGEGEKAGGLPSAVAEHPQPQAREQRRALASLPRAEKIPFEDKTDLSKGKLQGRIGSSPEEFFGKDIAHLTANEEEGEGLSLFQVVSQKYQQIYSRWKTR